MIVCRNKEVINDLLNEMEKYRLKDDYLYKERIYIDYNGDINCLSNLKMEIHTGAGSIYTHHLVELPFESRRVRLKEFEITIFTTIFNNKSYILNVCIIENIYDRIAKMEFNF